MTNMRATPVETGKQRGNGPEQPEQRDHRGQRGLRSLALSALVGPISWSAFFIIGYLIAEAACVGGFWQSNVAGLSLVVVVIVALATVFTLISAGAAVWTYRRWRAADDRERQTREGEHVQQTEDLGAFLALAATGLNVLFALAIVITAASMIFLVPCRWT